MHPKKSIDWFIQMVKDRSWRRLPTGIWALGFVSLLMDTSSELIHSIFPVYLTATLGASMITVGMIEGAAEATANILKIFSGVTSDYLRKRKFIVVTGYALSAFTKPVFPLASSVGWIFAARFTDRIGKGIRDAPRDALVAGLTPSNMRGAAYGLRQALDSVGALLGPLLALLFMIWFLNDVKSVMWVAALPAFLAVLVLILYVKEPERTNENSASRKKITFSYFKLLPSRYWVIVMIGSAFTLARFSEAFLILRARDSGISLGLVPLIMILMNLFYAGAAYPAGEAADRISPRTLLFMGLVLLILADLVLAFAVSPVFVYIGAALWGLHMAFTQGLLSKLVSDTAPPEMLGTGFGIFNLISGISLLFASVIAGTLWDSFGPAVTFLTGAGFAATAALGLTANDGNTV